MRLPPIAPADLSPSQRPLYDDMRSGVGAKYDAGYKKRFIDAVQSGLKRAVEVVLRPKGSKGFVLLPKRWRVEQSIGVLTGSRRLKVDYETLLHVSAGAMLFASIGRMLASITMS